MEFSKKYRHCGYAYPGVPKFWVKIVERSIIKAEKIMWPQWWMPRFVKRSIHWLATGNSCVRIKYWWAYNLRNRLTRHQSITDIKEKYGQLRIYGSFCKEINDIFEDAVKECENTCQDCGSKNDVRYIDQGWVYVLCVECRNRPEFSPTREVLIEKTE